MLANMTQVVACPHCGTVLDPPPANTGPCRHCGQKIVRRKTAGAIRFMTPTEADYIADRNKALKSLDWLGISADDFDAEYTRLRERFGTPPGRGDTFWSIATQLAIRYQLNEDWHVTGQLKHAMALHLKREGRDWRRLATEANDATIHAKAEQLRHMGLPIGEWRAIPIANACCPHCAKLHLKPFPFDTAMGALPPESCSGEWCSCSWGFEGI